MVNELVERVEWKLNVAFGCTWVSWCCIAQSIRITFRSNLVDPASSHMLVSKIKPCMSKYELNYGETANGSLQRLWRARDLRWIFPVTLELIHVSAFISFKQICRWVMVNGWSTRRPGTVSAPSASMVGYWPTIATTGNEELGFDFGEGAWETATTSTDGSRRANYPMQTLWGSNEK